MAEKTLKTRIQLKNETAENWGKAINFTPKQGEMIVYNYGVTRTATHYRWFKEVPKNDIKIRINPKEIPSMEKKLLCTTFLDAVIRFYQNTDNELAFRKWCTEKGGKVNG